MAVIVLIGLNRTGFGSSSGSSSNAAKGMYVLSVTATSTGSTAKTTPLVVTVQ